MVTISSSPDMQARQNNFLFKQTAEGFHLYTVPLKCNVALVRDSHSRLDNYSQSTIEGVTYEKRPRNKFVLGSLNSQVTINSYSGVLTLERADFRVTRSYSARYWLVGVALELRITSVFASSPASAITFHHVKNQKAVYAQRCFLIRFIVSLPFYSWKIRSRILQTAFHVNKRGHAHHQFHISFETYGSLGAKYPRV